MNDQKQGFGRLYMVNNGLFSGHFKDDFIDGEGEMSYRGTRLKGVWGKNKFLYKIT
jgi:hypothetical protein